MGLDTSHNCWHGSYTSFNEFRFALGRQIGINLSEYIGFGGDKDPDSVKHDANPLLFHSDCDGELSVDESKRIVTGLNDILEKFNLNIANYTGIEQDIIQFRDGCLDAISKNETIDFH